METFLILGHPHETWQTAWRTLRFASELNAEVPILGIMVPYPGTAVGEMAARGEGGYRLLTEDWNAYNKQLGHALAFDGLSRRQLEALQAWGYVKVFVDNRRWGELTAFVARYRSEGWHLLRKVVTGRGPAPTDPGFV